ncbi:MAG TPA: hypothetical protein VJ417_01005, partial [Candidatus Glassbacteria bacterium]|nr:hypothetical protein [Candidatus Glassbacteria bacterium]
MKLLEKLSLTVLCLLLISGVPARLPGESFKSNWQPDIERPWIGADYWSNPLPDWRLRNGRAECWRSGSDRNVYLLTAELTESGTGFVMEVITGALEPGGEPLSEGWVGFKVGSRGEFNDYRDTAIRGFGLAAGVTTDGKVFIGDPARGKMFSGWPLDEMRLRLEWNSGGGSLTLAVFDKAGKPESQITRTDINPGWLTGSGALVCSSALPYQMDWTAEPPKLGEMNPPYLANQSSGGNVHFWFRDWSLSGDKVALHQDRAYGPILFTCYTLSNRILKLTAHLAPVGNGSRVVYLQVKDTGGGAWKTVGEELL